MTVGAPVTLYDAQGDVVDLSALAHTTQDWARLSFISELVFGMVVVLLLAALTAALIWGQR